MTGHDAEHKQWNNYKCSFGKNGEILLVCRCAGVKSAHTHVQTGLELQDKTGYRPINGSMNDMAF